MGYRGQGALRPGRALLRRVLGYCDSDKTGELNRALRQCFQVLIIAIDGPRRALYACLPKSDNSL